jgi:FKBP-type peptidyl-prolyl cis-trans isomerase FkpA
MPRGLTPLPAEDRSMNRAPVILVLLVALGATMAGCDSDPTGTDPREVTFAPELGIDLSAMTRTSSGLYYQDVEVGTGTEAATGNTVGAYYRGWLPNGVLFDQRQPPSDPFRFQLGVGMVIVGWDEGVTGMRVGGVRKLVLPSALGYGNRPIGMIPANSVLVFEVNLVEVE